MKNESKHTQGEWKLSGLVMTNDKTEIHTEDRVHCQFIDSKFAITKPALAFGATKEEAEANAQRIVKCVNLHDDLIHTIRRLIGSINMTDSQIKEREVSRAFELLNQAEQK